MIVKIKTSSPKYLLKVIESLGKPKELSSDVGCYVTKETDGVYDILCEAKSLVYRGASCFELKY